MPKFVTKDGTQRSVLLRTTPPYKWADFEGPFYETEDPGEIAALDAHNNIMRLGGGKIASDSETVDFVTVKNEQGIATDTVPVTRKPGRPPKHA